MSNLCDILVDGLLKQGEEGEQSINESWLELEMEYLLSILSNINNQSFREGGGGKKGV